MLRSTFLDVWWRARWARYAFVAGMVLGVALGWAFHAVIGLFLRFGLALIILVPLLLIGYAVWRSRRGGTPFSRPPGGMTIIGFGGPNRDRGEVPWARGGEDRPAPPWARGRQGQSHDQEGPIGR